MKTHRGYFERAAGGTLFLDEITEMPPDMQVRLLRVLETGGLHARRRRPGAARATCASSPRPTAIRCRRSREGRLREDLMYRLAVFPIDLPPLRARGDDIELLARHFLDELNAEAGTAKTLSPAGRRRAARARLAGQRPRTAQRAAASLHHARRRSSTSRRTTSGPCRYTRPPPMATACTSRSGTSLADMERRTIYRDAGALRRQQAPLRRDPGREPEDALQPPRRVPARPLTAVAG